MGESYILTKKVIGACGEGGWICVVGVICGIEDDETWGAKSGETCDVNNGGPRIPLSLRG